MHIVEARPLPQYRLFLRFGNGRSGEVDLSSLKFIGAFAPLRDPEYFSQVTVNPAWGTVVWPNGTDMDPDVLYSEATGAPPPVGNRADAPPPSSAPNPKFRPKFRPSTPATGPLAGRRTAAPQTTARKAGGRPDPARNRPVRNAPRPR